MKTMSRSFVLPYILLVATSLSLYLISLHLKSLSRFIPRRCILLREGPHEIFQAIDFRVCWIYPLQCPDIHPQSIHLIR